MGSEGGNRKLVSEVREGFVTYSYSCSSAQLTRWGQRDRERHPPMQHNKFHIHISRPDTHAYPRSVQALECLQNTKLTEVLPVIRCRLQKDHSSHRNRQRTNQQGELWRSLSRYSTFVGRLFGSGGRLATQPRNASIAPLEGGWCGTCSGSGRATPLKRSTQ